MADYWIKASPDAPADGPISALEVKRRAAAGEIERTTLISMDRSTWHPAGRVKGLFPAMAQVGETVAAVASDRPVHGDGDGDGDGGGVAQRPARRPVPPVYPGMERRHVDASPVAEVGTGDIEAQPPMPMPPVTSPDASAAIDTSAAAAAATPPPPLPTPAAHAPLSYATPRGMDARSRLGTPLRPRKTRAFLIVALLMVPVGLFHAYAWYASFAEPGDANNLLRFLASATWVGLMIPAFVMWLKWISAVHRDAGVVNGYRYPVSGAKAAGLLFVPLFNVIWAIIMPTRLATTVNGALTAAGLRNISSGTVTACQVGSVVAPLLGLYALTPLLCAITMGTIQDGFNRLAANQYAPAA
jgi:hypothetical protein